MLADIANWWTGQMRSLLPERLRGNAQLPDALIIAIEQLGENAKGALLLRRDGVETRLQSLDIQCPLPAGTPPHLATALRLPPGHVLSREVLLPMAAARNLQSVLGFEMDRLTPFTADEVFWGVSGITQDRARGRILLRLAIVPRATLAALGPVLARIGLPPSCIESEAGRIELGAAPRQGRYAKAFLPALCGVLFIACLAIPFTRQQTALDAAANIIAASQRQADQAQALRQQLITAAAGRGAIAQARRAGDALQVLSILTSALPDNTWLSDLSLKSGDLTFDGQSANAPQLIGLLSAVPGLRNPSFTAPVTRTADGKADLFSMHITVGP